jgi:hypothetical protein
MCMMIIIKKASICLIILLCYLSLIRADSFQPASLFDTKFEHGWFCQASDKFANVENRETNMFDFDLGWILNRRFHASAAFSFTMRNITDAYYLENEEANNLTFGYCGAKIGMFLNPSGLVVFDINMFIGYGALLYAYQDYTTGASFMVYEPSAGINVAIFDFAKAVLYIGYTDCDRVVMPNASSKGFSGLNWKIGLVLGKF